MLIITKICLKQLETQRLKLKMEKADLKNRDLRAKETELKKLIADFKKQSSQAELRHELKKTADAIQDNRDDFKDNHDLLLKVLNQENDIDFQVGDFVKLRVGNTEGQVTEIDGDHLLMSTETMTFRLPKNQLMKIDDGRIQKQVATVKTDILVDNTKFDTRLDIRGLAYVEAVTMVQEYLDRAVLASVSRVDIVHGYGTGALRRGVIKCLKGHPHVKDFLHPEYSQGGEGLTIVSL